MTNCHILGFNLPFTELIYLSWFLCKSRLNTGDRTLDTLYYDMEDHVKRVNINFFLLFSNAMKLLNTLKESCENAMQCLFCLFFYSYFF